MKYLLIMMICFPFGKAFSQSNKIACEKVKFHLNIIREYTGGKTTDSSLRRVESIAFLENLTGIEGSGDGTDIGKFLVTKLDYQKWKLWFERNKKFLLYNSKAKKVYVVDIRDKK